jgi:hypothetical protein
MKKFKRDRVSNSEAVVSINDNKFNFNPAFSKLSELGKFHYVEYYIDEKNREIGFKFTVEQTADSYSIFGGKAKVNNYRSSAGEIIKRYKWIKSIHVQKTTADKKFLAINRKDLWVIQLRPSFEYYVPRDKVNEITSGTKGIYKYLNEDNKIVYIGKGDVRKRYGEVNRKKWIFEKIEYSIIESESEQFEWEGFWIERFKSENSGELPIYNLVSGRKKVSP